MIRAILKFWKWELSVKKKSDKNPFVSRRLLGHVIQRSCSYHVTHLNHNSNSIDAETPEQTSVFIYSANKSTQLRLIDSIRTECVRNSTECVDLECPIKNKNRKHVQFEAQQFGHKNMMTNELRGKQYASMCARTVVHCTFMVKRKKSDFFFSSFKQKCGEKKTMHTSHQLSTTMNMHSKMNIHARKHNVLIWDIWCMHVWNVLILKITATKSQAKEVIRRRHICFIILRCVHNINKKSPLDERFETLAYQLARADIFSSCCI